MAVDGGERIDFMLSRFGAGVTNFLPFWQMWFMPRFISDVQAGFESEGEPVGGWAALSPAYAAWKMRKFPGRKILELTGRLKRSLTLEGGGLGPDGIYEEGPTSLTVGTSVPYARFHQMGTPKMPQRRFLWLSNEQAYGKLLHRYLISLAAETGLRTNEL